MAKTKILVFLLLMVSTVKYNEAAEEVNKATISTSCGDFELDSAGAGDIIHDIIKALKELLTRLEGLHIPALPTLKYPPGAEEGDISVALSLSNITLSGLLDMKPVIKPHVGVVFNKISLDIGHYSSGGHLLNLPFAGEGPSKIAIHQLAIYVYMGIKLDQRRLEVKFSNMNPGTDQGQLINLVLSSFGQDILDYLTIKIKEIIPVKEVADRIVTDIFNTALCPGWVSNNPLDDREVMAEFFSTLYWNFVEDLKVPGNGFDI